MMFKLNGARLATHTAAITAAVLTLSLPAAASGATGPTGSARASSALAPPEPITLQVQAVNGSGCPAGTAHVTANSDNTGFRVTYDTFIADDGAAAGSTDFRKACQISVRVHIPQGFTFALAEAVNRGRLSLPAGATALDRTNYYLTGSSDNNVVDHPFTGPASGTWTTSDSTPVAALVFAPCGADTIVNLVEELRVDAGSSNRTSFITMRRTDGDVDTLIQFQWSQC